MIKCLHIITLSQFAKGVMQIWNECDVENDFVCIDTNHFNNQLPLNVIQRLQFVSREELHALTSSEQYQLFNFVAMTPELYPYVISTPSKAIVLWTSVGYDIYGCTEPYNSVVSMDIYKPLTRQYLAYLHRKTLYQQVRHLIASVVFAHRTFKKAVERKKVQTYARELQAKALRRVDYVSTVLDSEYQLLCENPDVHAKFFNFKFTCDRNNSIDTFFIDFANAPYILVGNSGDETNNHLDVLQILRERNIESPLYVPLAYCGEPDYLKMIQEQVQQFPGSIAQMQMMDNVKYRETIHQCRVAVFGHIRQQAEGNIGFALRQGSKVFLYKDSMAYRDFKARGFIIFTIEDDLNNENINTPLTVKQIIHNRQCYTPYLEQIKRMKQDIKDIESRFYTNEYA